MQVGIQSFAGYAGSGIHPPTHRFRDFHNAPGPTGRTGLEKVPIESLRPTQVAVGMRAVAYKRAKVEQRARRAKHLRKFLHRRPIPSVVGPGGDLFMIDHHHLGLALWQSEIDTAYVRIVADLSGIPPSQFWYRMEARGLLYPFDESGARVSPARLPRRLGALRDDPYRDLAWSVREAGGFLKSHEPFSEFRWADFFRDRISERTLVRSYETAVERALALSRSRAARELPGFAG